MNSEYIFGKELKSFFHVLLTVPVDCPICMCPVSPPAVRLDLDESGKECRRYFVNLVGRVWSLLLRIAVLFDVHSVFHYIQVHLHIAAHLSSLTKLQQHRAGVRKKTRKFGRLKRIVITAGRRLYNCV